MEIDQRVEQVLSRLQIQSYTLQAKASGQNNDVVTIRRESLGDEVVFRFPRHRGAIEELGHEVPLLRALRGRLPVPIPDPIYFNLSPPEVGTVFMGYARLPGEPLDRALLEALPTAASKGRIAAQLGTFLVTLHGIPLEDFDPALSLSNDRATWERMYADVRATLFPLMRPDARQQISLHFESYLDDSASSSWDPCLIHGDFGPSNILYDASIAALSGILDWSSAGLGDPATDLAALIGPASYGDGFADLLASTYPPLAVELPRARFYIGTFALQDALFGLETGDVAAFEAGIAEYR